MKRIWMALVLSLTLSAPAAFANAFFGSNPQPGSLFWGGFSNGSVPTSITGPGFSGNVAAGQFQGEFNATSEPDGTLGTDDFFRFFCIDITHGVDAGPDPYTRITPTIDPTRIAELSQLFDQYYPNKAQSTYYNGAITSFGDFPDATSSAAFQLAVWEIVFDTDLNLATGTFTVDPSSAAFGAAQSELAWVAGHPGLAPGWVFYEFTSDSYQDYLSAEYTQPLHTNPEPGSLLLFCSAVIAAGAALRRRQTA